MRALLTRLWAVRRAMLVYAVLLLGGWLAGALIRNITIPEMRPMTEPMIHLFVMGAFVIYVIAAAIPFVPGAEIGFALLLMFGAKVAPLVYAGMVFALLLSYCVAALLPAHSLAAALSWLGLRRASAFVTELGRASEEERKKLLVDAMPSFVGTRFLRHRYLVLAVLLNTPGNSLIGGGGGLAFLAQGSGVFRIGPFLATVLVAVAPIPALFLLSRG
ncbi:hypothetical protein [Marinovum sp.]|uniref:hypothetical protein n=1 Tax=Marinovum sp. TaxID=2024839 RepID=UPI003A938E52